jgi:hypothetical protein
MKLFTLITHLLLFYSNEAQGARVNHGIIAAFTSTSTSITRTSSFTTTLSPLQQTQKKHQKHQKKTTKLSMGLEINVRIVGRKNSIESTTFLQESYEMYTKRLSSTIKLSTTFHKSNEELIKNLQLDSKRVTGLYV